MATALTIPDVSVKKMLQTREEEARRLLDEARLLSLLPANLPVKRLEAARSPRHQPLLVVAYCDPEMLKKLPPVAIAKLPTDTLFRGLTDGALPGSSTTCFVLDIVRDRDGGCRWFTNQSGQLFEVQALGTSLLFNEYDEIRVEGTRLSVFRKLLVSKEPKSLAQPQREPLAVYNEAKDSITADLRRKPRGAQLVSAFNMLATCRLRHGGRRPEHVKAILAELCLSEDESKLLDSSVALLPSFSSADQDAFVRKHLQQAEKWVTAFFRKVCDAQHNSLDIHSLARLFKERTSSPVELSLEHKALRTKGNVVEYHLGLHLRSCCRPIVVAVSKVTPGFPAFDWVTLSRI